MKYLITIILILTLFIGCTVKRYSAEESVVFGRVRHRQQHPVRPDICPKEFISPRPFPKHIMPGDKVYLLTTQDKSKHQKCYDLYGGCAYYCLDKDLFSGPDAGCIDWQIDKETCLAKGGEWYNTTFIIAGDWCWWPFEE